MPAMPGKESTPGQALGQCGTGPVLPLVIDAEARLENRIWSLARQHRMRQWGRRRLALGVSGIVQHVPGTLPGQCLVGASGQEGEGACSSSRHRLSLSGAGPPRSPRLGQTATPVKTAGSGHLGGLFLPKSREALHLRLEKRVAPGRWPRGMPAASAQAGADDGEVRPKHRPGMGWARRTLAETRPAA